MSCKHGLSSEKVCSLCKGVPQDTVLAVGPPPWLATLKQMAVRTQFSYRGVVGFVEEGPQGVVGVMPKGTRNKNATGSMPYKHGNVDNKTKQKYALIRGEELKRSRKK